jgi:ABC-type transport system substrate-binding protein
MKHLKKFAIGLVAASSFAQSTVAQAADRKDQVIFELPGALEDPPNFNWYFPGPNGEARRENGAHQAIWEPLFLFNYKTGSLEPWLAVSLEPNDKQDIWILKLRHDVKWSDGAEFTAEDVVFTATMVLKYDLPALEAVTFRAQVDHVTLGDKWTVTFTLRKPNPRFKLENFGAPMFGSFLIVPKHIWEPQDFKSTADIKKFKFSNPIGTGPYKLEKAATVAANTIASTAAGSSVLTFGNTTGILSGMTAVDITNPNAILNGSIVESVTTTTVTLNSVAPATVGSGDLIHFVSHARNVTWARDDNWWGAKPDPATHKPVFKSLPEPLELIWQVENGPVDSKTDLIANKIDAARPYSFADFTDAKSQNAKIVGWDPASPLAWNDPCARQIEINTEHSKSPASPNWNSAISNWIDLDPASANYASAKAAQIALASKVRQAVSLLIDRAKLAHDAYSDTTKPSATMFADYGAMKPFIDAVVNANYGLKPNADPAAADSLLNQSGFKKDPADHYYHDASGAILGATLRVNSSVATDVAAANALSSQLNAAGVKLAVESIPNDQFWGHVVPTGDYEMIYGWMSCGSVGEPYTSMNRYTADNVAPLGYRSPGFNNTGRWDTPGEKAYSGIVADLDKKAMGNTTIPGQVAQAYKYLAEEMPFIPIVQSPTIVPFNTTYWVGWPTQGGDTVPMTGWESTIRLLFELKAR